MEKHYTLITHDPWNAGLDVDINLSLEDVIKKLKEYSCEDNADDIVLSESWIIDANTYNLLEHVNGKTVRITLESIGVKFVEN